MTRRRRPAGGGTRPALAVALGLTALLLAEPALTASLAVPATRAQYAPVGHRSFVLASGPTYSSVLGLLSSVTFSVAPAAGRANARVRTSGTPNAQWVPCTTADGGTTWRCDLGAVGLSALSSGRTFSWVAAR